MDDDKIDVTNIHRQPIYKTKGLFPVSERLGRNGLYLPSSSHLSKKDKDRVIAVIKEFFILLGGPTAK